MVWSDITPVKVTQSNTTNSFDASYAVDKDLSTRSISSPDGGQIWFKLELSETLYIYEIVIYSFFYADWYSPAGDTWCFESAEEYRSCITHCNVGVDVAVYLADQKQISCGTLSLTDSFNQADQIYSFLCGTVTQGDTILLSKGTASTDSWITLSEIVVRGSGMETVNYTELKNMTWPIKNV